MHVCVSMLLEQPPTCCSNTWKMMCDHPEHVLRDTNLKAQPHAKETLVCGGATSSCDDCVTKDMFFVF